MKKVKLADWMCGALEIDRYSPPRMDSDGDPPQRPIMTVPADALDRGSIAASNANFAIDALARIAFIREFETQILSLAQTNPPRIAGSVHLCAGHEAIPVGAVAGLHEDDQIISTYRGHGWALASGLDPGAVMAEVCQRANGINNGRAGSAYLMAPNTRFIGENGIVGAGPTIACGVAMANVAKANGKIVVVAIGDGAMNQGAVYEAFAFAAAKKLPVIFVIENNGWSEMTATSAMFPIQRLAQRGGGFGIPSATIDGTDPIVVRDSFTLAADRARKGDGPSLLECRVARLWAHSNRDIEHYRPKEDKRAAEAMDPLKVLGERIIRSQLMAAKDVEALIDDEKTNAADLARLVMESQEPDPSIAAQNVIGTPVGTDNLGSAETKEMTYIEAVNKALRTELENDPATIVYGEDLGKSGGCFGETRYLQRDFGPERVFDTPISENAILGSAVGAAIMGMKPIVEIMWGDFIFVAMDQLVNQAANIRYITGGSTSVPMVVRIQQGATPGSCAQHSQSVEAMLTHVPGLKVAIAASATDAYALLRAATADPDPCIVFEVRAKYQSKSPVSLTKGAERVGKARLRRAGKDAGIIAWGTMVDSSLEAAEELAKSGVETAVLDPRWLVPLDEDSLVSLVKAVNGKILIVHEAVRTGGFASEIAMRIHELLPDTELKIHRLTTRDVRIPASPGLQTALIPQTADIKYAVEKLLKS